jgi:hypothetical protein
MVNLFFAGLLAWFYPLIDSGLGGVRDKDSSARGGGGPLGLFAGFNVIAFLLVYFIVEETKQMSLEDLEQIYKVPKRDFAKFQATEYLPWILRRLLKLSNEEKPNLYDDNTNSGFPSPAVVLHVPQSEVHGTTGQAGGAGGPGPTLDQTPMSPGRFS